MNRIVYIVHCVDTEGPLYESIEDTFRRIEEIFEIRMDATVDNLNKLQQMQIDLGGRQKEVYNLVAPARLKLNETWDQINRMLDEITSDTFRYNLPDSQRNGWIYNWFCLDHVGFVGNNPRRRDVGHHNIFDHYKRYLKKSVDSKNDIIQWHYHPISFSGHYHACATAYINGSNIFEILSRKIIDRHWFPAIFRPGFHAERPDSNWFLEQWIPFDYANQSVEGVDTDQPDLSNGRFGDWRRAPKDWVVYHPSHDDYQVPGNCRRWVARCLNMEARLREITVEEFKKGFSRANQGKPTIISFTNHDFRDMKTEILKIQKMIQSAQEEYPEVKFIYSNAIDAMRNVLHLEPLLPDLNLEFKRYNHKNEGFCRVSASNNIFGPQPFLAIKTVNGQYLWDNMDFQEKNEWTYTFDWQTLPLNALEKIGIAVNSPEGVTEVILYDVINDQLEKEVYNI